MTDKNTIEAPRIYPTLRCRDAEAMMRWLKDIIGFTEYVVYRGADGVVHHAELAYGSSILMLGQSRDDEYGKLVGDIGGRRTNSLYVCRHRSRRAARQGKGRRRQDRDGTVQHRLRQPRFRLPRSGRQSLEFWHVLAEGDREAAERISQLSSRRRPLGRHFRAAFRNPDQCRAQHAFADRVAGLNDLRDMPVGTDGSCTSYIA